MDKPSIPTLQGKYYIPEGWQGKYPPCLIQVDAEGRMFHNGAPIIHPEIIKLIYESVHYEDGRYVLRIGEEVCELEVTDTFFVVRAAEPAGEKIKVTLNDSSSELVDPGDFWIGKDNIIYCLVKARSMPARLLRPAYYQLAQLIEELPEGGFAIVLGNSRWPLKERTS